MSFQHQALSLQQEKPLVYTAMSKHLFYFRMQVSVFVLEQGAVPLNPFLLFDYYFVDAIDRDVVREANNNVVRRADELWVFGPISDGVLAEILQAKEMKKPIRYFQIIKSTTIVEINVKEVEMEKDVEAYREQLF